MFAADLDGDGVPDLGIARTDGFVEIVLGSGGGSFQNPRYIPVPVGDVIVDDFNRDGLPDVVVGSRILLGTGGGHFAAPADLPGEIAGPYASGDFNQDGVPDLVVTGPFLRGGLFVALADGLGGFSAGQGVPGGNDPYYGPVVSADFDGDGKSDLAFLRFSDIAVVRGLGGGLFESAPTFATSNFPNFDVAADINGDGAADLVVVGGSDGFDVLLSNGDGTLGAPIPTSLPQGYHSVAVGDFNEDGHMDVAATTQGAPNPVSILLGDGSGHFGARTDFPAGVLDAIALAADLNGDGHLDVLLASGGGFALMVGDGHGHLSSPQQLSFGAFKYVLADVNHDGRPDLVTISGSQLQAWLGDGHGGFLAGPIMQLQVIIPGSLVVADLDGDGNPDVAVNDIYGSSPSIQIQLGDGTGGFPTTFVQAGPFAGGVFAGEFLGDGRAELAVTGADVLVTYRFDRSSGLTRVGSVVTPGYGLLVADFTGDGKPDFAGANPTSGGGVWLLTNTTCQPRRLAVARNVPSCDVPGSPFAVQPVVRVEDDGGNVIACGGPTVTAAIAPGTGPQGASLGGTAAVPAVAGVATFSDLSVDQPGRGYRLLFTTPGVHAAGSEPFSQGLSAPVITGPPQSCTGGPGRFQAPPGYDTYLWTLDGSVVGRLRVVTLPGLAPGLHTLGLTVTQDSCSASSSLGVTPQTSPPAPVASNNGPVPSGGTIQLFASAVPEAIYQWTGPRGFTSMQQNPTVPNASPAAAGTYSVVAVVGGCVSPAASTMVTVIPPPWCAGCSNASFGAAARAFDAGGQPAGIAVGDFDGDGILDVVVTHAGGSGTITVFLGDGRGGFGAGIDSPSTTYATQVLAADLNGDGLADLVVTAQGQLWILLATGGGHFGSPRGVPGVLEPVIGDFNEDGLPDLAGASTASNAIAVLLGDGSGGFGTPSNYPTNGFLFRPPVVSDLNRDGHQDIVAGTSEAVLVVLLGNGSGGFLPGPPLAQSLSSNALAVGDLDGDGIADLVSGVNDTNGTLSLFRGVGDGSFAFVHDITVPIVANPMRIADVNGDGKNDIVFLGLEVLISRGAFDFDPPLTFLQGNGPDFALADVDRDGRLDIISAGSQSFAVLRGGGPTGFLSPPSVSAQASGAPVIADFNRDGHPDVAVPAFGPFGPPRLSILLNDGSGSLGPPMTIQAGASPSSGEASGLAVGDFNEDGALDFAVSSLFPGGLSVVLSDGFGGFIPPVDYPLGAGIFAANGVVVGDFNGDGHKDIAVASSPVTVLLGDGHGNFGVPGTLPVSPSSMATADFNHDGRDDLVITGGFPASVSLYLANPDGTFGQPLTIPLTITSPIPAGIVVADFNNDGNMDVAVAGDQLAVLLGNGSGGLSAPTLIGSGMNASQIVAGDFNGDGKLDLALMLDRLAIFSGDGTGQFFQSTAIAIGVPVGVAVADLDGDSRPDLVVAGPGGISTVFNTNCVPRRLGPTTSPSCSPVGAPLSPQPVVDVLDDGANVVLCDSGQVTSSIAAGTGAAGAVLSGTSAVNAVSGVATFTNLAIDRAGTNYQLEFHHPIASFARSARFTVGSAPPPPVASHNAPVCLGSTLQLTASAVPGGIYRWTGPNGFSSTVRNPSIPNVTSAASGVYSVTVSVNGCVSSAATTPVTVLTPPSAAVSAPASVCARSAGNTASVPDAGPGASYVWTISNGVITSRLGATIGFTAGAAGPVSLSVTVTDAQGCASTGSSVVAAGACAGSFYTLTPCRLIDTRSAPGPYGAPSLSSGQDRAFTLAGQCGIPADAVAVSVNVAVVQPTSGPGFLTIYPAGTARPVVSTINYRSGQTRANNAIVALGAGGDVTIHCAQGGGTADVVIDVNGYFR